jgi:hypothetical protein
MCLGSWSVSGLIQDNNIITIPDAVAQSEEVTENKITIT